MIARIALRDRRAFAALYDATSAKLFGVCLRVLKNRGEAEDWLTRHGYPEAELQDVTVPAPNAGRAA